MTLAYQILISLAAIFGLYRIRHTDGILLKIILLGMAAGVGLTMVTVAWVKTTGLLLFAALVILMLVSALIDKKNSPVKKTLILLMTIPLLLYYLFSVQHYPGASVLMLVCFISFIAVVIALSKKMAEFKNEMGIIVMLGTDALITSSIIIISYFT